MDLKISHRTMHKTFPLIICTFTTMMLCGGCSTLRFKSGDGIRKSMIKKTPLGSSSQEVVSFIESNNHRWKSTGTPTLEPEPAYDFGHPRNQNPTGKKSIGPLHIDSYYSFFPGFPIVTDVVAVWAFDEDETLIDIKVEKEYFVP